MQELQLKVTWKPNGRGDGKFLVRGLGQSKTYEGSPWAPAGKIGNDEYSSGSNFANVRSAAGKWLGEFVPLADRLNLKATSISRKPGKLTYTIEYKKEA